MQNPIQFQAEEYPSEEILDNLHPFVKEWFTSQFSEFSPPQKYSIRNIQLGINSLISSPTGSGKTLSAFLAIINELVLRSDTGTLEDRTYCVYISPLKALANDINKNLTEPLEAIAIIAEKYGRHLNIRIGTRTGDTEKSKRAGHLLRPPHILITTPESLAIALTSIKFSQILHGVKYVIIDEIHALAENKRGTHLMLAIERLAIRATFTRIGLSATVAPLEEVAKFLVGYEIPDTKQFRECKIVDVQAIKKLDLKVLSPVPDMMNTTHAKMQDATYQLLHDLIQSHRTTLVFTNTRSGTERVVHNLRDKFPKYYANVLDADEEQEKKEEQTDILDDNLHEELESAEIEALEETEKKLQQENKKISLNEKENKVLQDKGLIGAHHGSLSKEHRLRIENMLKAGQLKSVVCSTSLELGIDIGFIDLVILLGSPKSVARALQRIGRSGHKLHEEAKGRIIVTDRDDLVECSMLLKAAVEKKIDKISITHNALDVLAQHIFGLSIENIQKIEDAWQLVRKSYAYETLTRHDFDAVLNYLSGDYTQLEERHIYAKIWIDREAGTFGKRGKLARLLYMTNVGTIPDEAAVHVKVGEHTIGTVTEDFSERLKPGDVFVLGGEAYEFKFSRGMTMQVRTSAGRMPTVPNWVSEMLPLSFDLAESIQKLRRHVASMLQDENYNAQRIREWLRMYLYVDEQGIEAIARYFEEQHKFSIIPHDKRLLIEHFRDGNKKYVFVHSLYGRRTNDVLARAIAYVNGKITGRDVEIGITDNGFYLKSTQPIQALRSLKLLKEEELYKLMEIAIDQSEVLKRRFRHCATRALMILRQYKGQHKSVGRQQISSTLIINSVRRIGADFPILKEAKREILENHMDIMHAREIIKRIQNNDMKIEERTVDLPSPFAFNMVLQGYIDLLKMEDRVAFVQRMHKMVLEEISGVKKKKDEQVLPAVEFTYEKLWDLQEEENRKKQENYKEYLQDQLRASARKIGLDADLYYHANRLVEGDTTGYPDKFKDWLHGLITGTVPTVWKDDLIKYFREKEKLL